MEHWNGNNLSDGSTEEFKYSEYISNTCTKVFNLRGLMYKFDMNVYHAIKNNKPKIKQTEQLDKINKLLDEIKNILESEVIL
ncbi:hypothetical protein [Clostridium sp.]|uniref:hypothetical protein n=1 Tax=Clostridium sp. TaxID=1506 RepID=UPI002629E118|nr:hypothetical protein [Clostridium sp.]